MKILVTGAKGFVGKNLIAELNNIKFGKRKHNQLNEIEIYEYDIDTNPKLLDIYTQDCDFVFHLAGVNRPKNEEEFMEGNFGFTSTLLNSLSNNKNESPVLITSSIQAELDNPYGKSKKEGEDLIFSYGNKNKVKTLVYRLPNVFGKWCKPNYNSAIATFCNNVANDLEIKINDPKVIMNTVYIDDVVEEFINALCNKENKKEKFCFVEVTHTITLGEIVDKIYSFKNSRIDLSIPKLDDAFTKKLYSTYLNYLPTKGFSYPLKMNIDDRGSFTEIIRTADRGQFSVNISKPGITKGNHWHNTKNEKFVVVSGEGLIQFRNIHSNEIIDYKVSGDKIEVVDIPVGYTHNIINLGKTDLITFMWCNECFDPNKPDTYFEEVSKNG